MPPALQARILQFFEYRYPERRSFDGYKIIRDLPVSLQKDLAAHVHGGVVSSSPILRRCSPKTTGELCLLFRRVFAAEGEPRAADRPAAEAARVKPLWMFRISVV